MQNRSRKRRASNIRRRRRVFSSLETYLKEEYGYGGYGGGSKYRGISTGTKFETNRPVKIPYRIQRLYKRRPHEPEGLYIVMTSKGGAEDTLHIKRPLVVEWGAKKGPENWAQVLSDQYDARGLVLTNQIKRDRHDAIITMRNGRPFQIVYLDIPEDLPSQPSQGTREWRKKIVEKERAKYFYSQPYMEFFDSYTYEEKARLRTKISSLQTNIEEIQEEWEEYVARRDTLVDSIERNYERIDEFIDTLWDLRKELDRLEIIERGQYDLFESPQEYSAEDLGDIDSKIVNLQKKITTIEENRDTEKGYLEGSEETLDKVRSELEDIEENRSDFEHQLHQSEEKLSNMYGGSEDNFQDDVEEVLGEDFDVNDVLALSGVEGLPTSETYDISISSSRYHNSSNIKINVSGPYIKAFSRTISSDKTIRNSHLILSKDAPKGLGARILYSQALAAEEMEMDQISCSAAKGDGYVGYYVWARLGYDSAIRDRLSYLGTGPPWDRGDPEKTYKELIRDGYFPEYITEETPMSEVKLSDLIMTKKGRDLWLNKGDTWFATFSTKSNDDGSPSRSMQVLSSYIRGKEEAMGPMDRWASELEADDELGVAEIRLTPEDEKILDRVWDRLLIREILKRRKGL